MLNNVTTLGSICDERDIFLFRYIDDPKFEDNIKLVKKLNKPLIGACFEANLNCTLPRSVELTKGTGTGISHTFDSEQLLSLIGECRGLVYSTGDIDPPSEEPPEPASNTSSESWPAVSVAPAMESGQRNEAKKKHHVQFAGDDVNDRVTSEESQIKPLAACTVAAAMVGAAAEHLNLTRKASSAGMRAATATAKVARAVAHGDADAATDALSEVVKIVDGLSKQKENGYDSPPKSKTCVIL